MKAFITEIEFGMQRVNLSFFLAANSCTSRGTFILLKSRAISIHCKSFNTLFITWWSTIKVTEVGQNSNPLLCSLAEACKRKIRLFLYLFRHHIFLCYQHNSILPKLSHVWFTSNREQFQGHFSSNWHDLKCVLLGMLILCRSQIIIVIEIKKSKYCLFLSPRTAS